MKVEQGNRLLNMEKSPRIDLRVLEGSVWRKFIEGDLRVGENL